ncbi:uncharacterized protein I206_101786 [Kwoniella pini CBS 10737]|uniref:Uncharacterized protein n=1 Tax=Kwoniella pini CBS 10737 TaxID=1296096 RepID=A0A1B9HVQ8_9TREE|nr:uncharacterized protein I206_06242 [Kwoniella pini CBS 10737]OCF47346.1 hypothetical protein I206_06242 [Kwoniella pini CBS 10737]
MISLAIFTHLLCVLGAYIACYRSIKTYIVILSLRNYAEANPTATPLPIEEDEKADHDQNNIESAIGSTDTAEPRKAWWRRIVDSNGFIITVFLSLSAGLAIFLVYGVPKITSKFIRDNIWTLMAGYSVYGNIFSTLQCILPRPRIDKLIILKDNTEKTKYKYESKQIYQNQSSISLDNDYETGLPIPEIPFYTNLNFLRIVSVLITTAILTSGYFGSLWLSSLVALSQVIISAGMIFLIKISIRFVLILLIGMISIGAVAIPMLNHFLPNNNKGAPEQKDPLAPPWALNVFMMYNVGMGMMLPAILLAATHRFEYLNSSTYALNEPTAKNGEIHAPLSGNHVPRFKKPITSVGFVSYIASTVFFHVTASYTFGEKGYIDSMVLMGIMFYALPITTLGMFLTASWNGNLRQWLDHRDQWLPQLNPEHVEQLRSKSYRVTEKEEMRRIDDDLMSFQDEKREPLQSDSDRF